MKKFLSALVLVFMVSSFLSFGAFAQNDEISVYLDASKVEFDVKPQIINGRTMVPIRAIFEKMGATVNWDEKTKTAICQKGETEVKMTVDSMDMYINGELNKMDVEPVVIDGRTLAPARYVAEAFEATVEWSAKNRMVVISSKDVYAYQDYPDIPDLGKCYNISPKNETAEGGVKIFTYVYSDMTNDEYYSYLYDNSAKVLGGYSEETVSNKGGVVTIAYTKRNEKTPRYHVVVSYDENDNMIFDVKIPDEQKEDKVILYAADGRTIEVPKSEVEAHKNVGWYETPVESKQTLYAADGRTIEVPKSEVEAYKNVGWYETPVESKQTLYAADGRTVEVPKSEVEAYKSVGWYETPVESKQTLYAADGRTVEVPKSEVESYVNVGWYRTRQEAENAKRAIQQQVQVQQPQVQQPQVQQPQVQQPASSNSSNVYNPGADGNYYRTPYGTKYHLDPNCGGKNSYKITNTAGLGPCSKCAK